MEFTDEMDVDDPLHIPPGGFLIPKEEPVDIYMEPTENEENNFVISGIVGNINCVKEEFVEDSDLPQSTANVS